MVRVQGFKVEGGGCRILQGAGFYHVRISLVLTFRL